MEARLAVPSPEALAALYYPNGRLGGLTVPGKPPGALAQQLTLFIEVEKPARQFQLRGQIAWVRHKAGPNQPTGYGFDFDPDDDATRVRLLAFARREVSSDATRVEARQQVELQVRLVHEGRQRKEWMADLSLGGAFVRTWNPLPIGATVALHVRPSFSLTSIEIPAHVAWVRLAGAHPGMGLEFASSAEMRARIEKLISKVVR
ncbi:MAG: PilZ domain-containing protein [Archangium sp.]|nr:PilZ domain-containing protein [Archangium sp.]